MRPIDAATYSETLLWMLKNGDYRSPQDAIREAIYCLTQAPTLTIDQLRPKGWWIRQDETYTKFQCSVCKAKNYGGHERFCPNCGARNRTEPGIIVDVGIGGHPGVPGVEGSQDG